MPTPKSRTNDGTLFSRFSFIVKMRMRRIDWQCAWWWMGINTTRRSDVLLSSLIDSKKESKV
jgi:hypothetical protein